MWCDAWWRCGVVWCGVVWWWCGAVHHPSNGQGRQYQSFPGTSPGYSPGNHPRDTPGEPSPGYSRETGVTSGIFGRTIQRNTTTRQDNTDHRLRKSTICLLQHKGLLCTNTAHTYNRIVALCVPSLFLLMALKLHTKSHRSNAAAGLVIVGTFSNRPNTRRDRRRRSRCRSRSHHS